jgi:hypothetical protein
VRRKAAGAVEKGALGTVTGVGPRWLRLQRGGGPGRGFVGGVTWWVCVLSGRGGGLGEKEI